MAKFYKRFYVIMSTWSGRTEEMHWHKNQKDARSKARKIRDRVVGSYSLKIVDTKTGLEESY